MEICKNKAIKLPCTNISGYVVHVTVAYCLVVGLGLGLDLVSVG